MAYNIYICGIGGQGIIKTSIVIGETAIKEDYNVVMSEIHGMSQRGGVVSTELKIGDDKSPIIQDIDEILEELTSKMDVVYSMDANKIATRAGHPLSMNMAMLGGACAVESFPLEINDIKDTMKENLPPKSIDVNYEAFKMGYESCKK